MIWTFSIMTCALLQVIKFAAGIKIDLPQFCSSDESEQSDVPSQRRLPSMQSLKTDFVELPTQSPR